MTMRCPAGIEHGEEKPILAFLVKLLEALGVEPGRLFDER